MSPQVGAPLQALPAPPRQPARRGFARATSGSAPGRSSWPSAARWLPPTTQRHLGPYRRRGLWRVTSGRTSTSISSCRSTVRERPFAVSHARPLIGVVRVSPRWRSLVAERKAGRFSSGTCTDEQAPW